MKSNTRVQKFEVTVETTTDVPSVVMSEVYLPIHNGIDYARNIEVKEVTRKPSKSDALALADLIEEYIEAVDEENEHGDYRAPIDYIPTEFEDDEDGEDGRPDYWERHNEIVNNACKAGQKVRDFIAKLRGENN